MCKDAPPTDFPTFLREKGIDEETIYRVIKEGLHAKKKDEYDHKIRYKFLELTMKILGIWDNLKEDANGDDLFKEYSLLSDEDLEKEYRKRLETLRSLHYR